MPASPCRVQQHGEHEETAVAACKDWWSAAACSRMARVEMTAT
eukprot:CAMPEP_0195054432 /NCGR_PEP_ID=MMETSP0448-20130528/3382_1 /TAXON_ID=66468 /ORGANISM="Heterocapsa triquestra, Strain CCMP 448" /LENGTH=42 /DNA_ID= /DNA_START= /DNA_END= /DNA_ORIENTATION=